MLIIIIILIIMVLVTMVIIDFSLCECFSFPSLSSADRGTSQG